MDLLNRPRVVIAGVALTLVAAGYGMYQLLRDVVMVLMVLVILVLIAALVIIWLRQRKAKQASQEIESTISRQADLDIERSVPGQVAELESMKAELLAAIHALRASRRGQGALSTIPWYLVMGPAHSGKSMLVRQAGLSFPSLDAEGRGPRPVRGVGGTRALEWWLSEEAVLLEMPGRLLATAEFEDSDDWLAFLSVLRKQRPLRPIHGVIVPVAIAQIADRPDAELDQLGRRVRERVRELIQHLKVSFPTYLVFTGCDQIAGFSEFFGDLSGEQRAKPWGATLAVEDATQHPAETLFDAGCRELETSLSRLWLKRLPRLPDGDQRSLVFAFPSQIAHLRPFMRRFVKALFDSGEPKERPLFRGFYFVSASPGSGAVDYALKKAAGTIGLVPTGVSSPPPQGGGAWFVHELFTKVIFPDRELATDSTAEVERRRRARIRLVGALGFALLVLTVAFSGISCSNRGFARRTLDAARQLAQVSQSGDFKGRVEALDSLRAQIVRLETLQGHTPWWRHLGGYWGDDLIEPALRLHTKRGLIDLVGPALPRMKAALESEISAGQTPFITVFNRYWAWRLLMNPDEIDPEMEDVVGEEVRAGLVEDIRGVDHDNQGAIAQKVERNIAFLVRHGSLISKLKNTYAVRNAPELEDSAATWLRTNWADDQFFRHMIQTSRRDSLDLAALVGQPELLTADLKVSGPYTRDGWQAIRPRIEWYRDRMRKPWLVQEFGGKAELLSGRLEQQYADAYTREWQGFLASVRVEQAGSWPTAAGRLGTLAREGSSLFQLLKAAARHTNLDVDRASTLGSVAADFQMLQDFEAGGSSGGTKQPGWFRRSLRFVGGIFRKKPKDTFNPASSNKTNYQQELNRLVEKVGKLAQPSASGKDHDAVYMGSEEEGSAVMALRTLAERLQGSYKGRGNDAVIHVLWLPLTVLPGFKEPPPLSGQNAGETGDSPGLPSNVRAAWQQQVVAPFETTLRGKYPLGGGPDASRAAFGDFFKPGGTFWSFYDTHLKKYLSEDGTPTPGAQGLVSAELKAAVSRARDIRDAFFAVGGGLPELRMRVRPQVPDPSPGQPVVAWTEIEIGGQPPLHWSGGPRIPRDMDWPGSQPDLGARVSANAGVVAGNAEAPGEWAFFRLLDRARLQEAGSTTTVNFRVTVGGAVRAIPFEVQLQGGSSRHPFKKDFLLKFKLPGSI